MCECICGKVFRTWMERDSCSGDGHRGVPTSSFPFTLLAANAVLKRLREAVEWAIQYLERDVFNVDEVNALIEWMIAELRRRAKEG